MVTIYQLETTDAWTGAEVAGMTWDVGMLCYEGSEILILIIYGQMDSRLWFVLAEIAGYFGGGHRDF